MSDICSTCGAACVYVPGSTECMKCIKVGASKIIYEMILKNLQIQDGDAQLKSISELIEQNKNVLVNNKIENVAAPIVKEADPELEALLNEDEFNFPVKQPKPAPQKKAVLPSTPIKKVIPPMAANQLPIIVDGSQKYVPVQLDADTSIKFYLNYDPSLPHNTLVYDYFGNGEMYYNPKQGQDITEGKATLKTLYVSYFLKDTALRTQQAQPGIKVMDLATSTYTPSGVMGWAFALHTFFASTTNPDFVENAVQPSDKVNISGVFSATKTNVGNAILAPTPAPEPEPEVLGANAKPICAWYSDPEREIYSEHYKYANHVPGLRSCCNTKIFDKANHVVHCGWSNDNTQSTCVGYEPVTVTVKHVQVKQQFTENPIDFKVQSFLALTGEEMITIRNETDNNIVQQILVPSDTDQTEVINEVDEILATYTDCYENAEQVDCEIKDAPDEDVQRVSFINTLLPV